MRYSTFLEAVQTDQVAKVTFSADGRQVLCVDKDGKRHVATILPEQSAEKHLEVPTVGKSLKASATLVYVSKPLYQV